MPTFMDVHHAEGITEEDAAQAHEDDLQHQGKHGAEFLKYWIDEDEGKVFCLSQAPSKEAALAVHEDAGHPPDEIYEVTEGS